MTFLRYVGVGLFTNGLLYILFVVLVSFGLAPATTAGLCYGLGLMMSYVLNRKWSFKSDATHTRDLPRFLFAYGVGFVATMIFIVLLTKVMRPEIAQILNIGMTAVVIYSCLRLTKFGKQRA